MSLSTDPLILPCVRLKIARRSSHPWIFQKMVEKPGTKLPCGTVVDIVDRENQWVGRGFYNSHSRIALRVLTADPSEAIDEPFFATRINRAVALRRDWLGLDAVTNAYRLVHSEGDGLSGLVVDRFGGTIVLEYFAAGMYRFQSAIRMRLATCFPNSKFYWFAEDHVQKQESFNCRSPEAPEPEIITEHGLRFRVAPGSKHKTGFFLDQRTTGVLWQPSVPAGVCSTCVAIQADLPSMPKHWERLKRSSAWISMNRRWPWRGRTPI